MAPRWKSFNHNLLCETISTLTHLINFVAQFLRVFFFSGLSIVIVCSFVRGRYVRDKAKNVSTDSHIIDVASHPDYITLEIEFSEREQHEMEKRQPQNWTRFIYARCEMKQEKQND